MHHELGVVSTVSIISRFLCIQFSGYLQHVSGYRQHWPYACPSTRSPVNSGRQLGPSTRVVETGLYGHDMHLCQQCNVSLLPRPLQSSPGHSSPFQIMTYIIPVLPRPTWPSACFTHFPEYGLLRNPVFIHSQHMFEPSQLSFLNNMI